ncbi:MAG: helix-turn-helix domain-containing protein [Chloroflexi bacterium]|nr:helix-turn-helix domain-containing protein [Chloroflexota bacterium]
MPTNYLVAIHESVEQLAAREKALRGQPAALRVHALRLLKRGQVRSLATCASQVGYSARQLRRWWRQYQRSGLDGLLTIKHAPGQKPYMTATAWSDLETEMRAGRIAQLADAQRWLRERHGIQYTLGGLWGQFQQHGIKLKTGRR